MTSVMMRLTDDPIPTRYSLLSRLQNWDDQESWKDFFDTYWHLIYSVALKSGLTDSEAQDVVQETVISVAKNIQKFKRDRRLGSFKGWLRNITRWRITDQLRKRMQPVPTGEERVSATEITDVADIADSAGAASEAVWEQEWKANLLEAAVKRVRHLVKEEHYQIFDLYALKQWPVRKVAETLGVNVAQVYLAKHRVAGLIRKEIRKLESEW